jgi:hypothetical protein
VTTEVAICTPRRIKLYKGDRSFTRFTLSRANKDFETYPIAVEFDTNTALPDILPVFPPKPVMVPGIRIPIDIYGWHESDLHGTSVERHGEKRKWRSHIPFIQKLIDSGDGYLG